MIKRRTTPHLQRYLDGGKIKRKRRQKKIIILSLICVAGLSLGYGFVYALNLPRFQVKSFNVVGASKIDTIDIERITKEIIAADKHVFGLVSPQSSLVIDDKVLEVGLLAILPRLKTIKVKSRINGVLELAITEREPLGKWCQTLSSESKKVTEKVVSDSTIVDSNIEIENEKLESGGSISDSENPSSQIADTSIPQIAPACYDLDANGYVFGPAEGIGSNTGTSTPFVFKGLLQNDPLGQYFLDEALLKKTLSFLDFLKEKNKSVSHVECDSLTTCSVVLANKAKIILNISEDLEITIDRFEVALETSSLKKDEYEYVDLRYGNKIFFKMRESKSSDASIESGSVLFVKARNSGVRDVEKPQQNSIKPVNSVANSSSSTDVRKPSTPVSTAVTQANPTIAETLSSTAVVKPTEVQNTASVQTTVESPKVPAEVLQTPAI